MAPSASSSPSTLSAPTTTTRTPATLPEMRVVGYARVSSRYQEPNGSLDDQAKRIMAECARRGWVIDTMVREAEDSEDMERPSLQALLARAQAGEFDVLVADKMDRFARAEPREVDYFITTLKHLGVATLILDLPDTGNEFIDETMAFFKKMFAREERRSITRRVNEGRLRRLRGEGRHLGMLVGPHPLYGYLWDDPTPRRRYGYKPDDGEDGSGAGGAAKWVRWIFEQAADGWSARQIAKRLNEMGVPTPRQHFVTLGLLSPKMRVATLWQTNTVKRLLDNPSYTGHPQAFRRRWLRPDKKMARRRKTGKLEKATHCVYRKPSDPAILPLDPSLCPPLVSEELAAKARATMAAFAGSAGRRLASRTMDMSHPRLLRGGFVRCAHCGTPMGGNLTGTKRTRIYQCTRHTRYRAGVDGAPTPCPGGSVTIHADPLDKQVWGHAVTLLTDGETLPAAVEALLRHGEAAATGRAARRTALLEQQGALEQRLGELQETLVRSSGLAGTRTWAKLEQDVREVETELDTLAVRLADLDAEADVASEHVRLVRSLAERQAREHNSAVIQLLRLDHDGKQRFLRELGLTVWVWNRHHKPRYGVRVGPPVPPGWTPPNQLAEPPAEDDGTAEACSGTQWLYFL